MKNFTMCVLYKRYMHTRKLTQRVEEGKGGSFAIRNCYPQQLACSVHVRLCMHLGAKVKIQSRASILFTGVKLPLSCTVVMFIKMMI